MTLSPDVNRPGPDSAVPAAPGTPAPVAGPKVSAPWTGALMALGALVAAAGAFFPYEKIVVFFQGGVKATTTFTGVGSRTSTGLSIEGLKAGNAGVIIVALSALTLVAGLLVVARKGRLWVGIVTLVLMAAAGVLCLAVFHAPTDDAKKLNDTAEPGWTAHALGKMGADITAVGIGIALLAAIMAIVVRRRRTA